MQDRNITSHIGGTGILSMERQQADDWQRLLLHKLK